MSRRGNGLGNLRLKSGPERCGVWEARTRHGGRQVSKTFRGMNRTEAENAFTAWRAELGENEPVRGSFGAVLTAWLEQARTDCTASTFREYARIVGKVNEDLGAEPLAKITTAKLETYYYSLSTAAKALAFHRVIRRALNYAVRHRLMPVNPAAGGLVNLPKHHAPEMVVVDDETAERLARAAFGRSPVLGSLVFVAISTGARRGELCAIRWEDVNLSAGTLIYRRSVADVAGKLVEGSTKAHAQRTVELDAVSVALLTELRAFVDDRAERHGATIASDGYVFSARPDCSTGVRPDYVSSWWRKLRKDVPGAEAAVFHSLRHLMATRWLSEGVPITIVSRRLGHRLVSTTMNIYSHVETGQQRAAAELMAQRLPAGEADPLLTVKVSGKTYAGALDPKAHDVAALGLPAPTVAKMGRGLTYTYLITRTTAAALLDYLNGRGSCPEALPIRTDVAKLRALLAEVGESRALVPALPVASEDAA